VGLVQEPDFMELMTGIFAVSDRNCWLEPRQPPRRAGLEQCTRHGLSPSRGLNTSVVRCSFVGWLEGFGIGIQGEYIYFASCLWCD